MNGHPKVRANANPLRAFEPLSLRVKKGSPKRPHALAVSARLALPGGLLVFFVPFVAQSLRGEEEQPHRPPDRQEEISVRWSDN